VGKKASDTDPRRPEIIQFGFDCLDDLGIPGKNSDPPRPGQRMTTGSILLRLL
jgi:hypothetical protein